MMALSLRTLTAATLVAMLVLAGPGSAAVNMWDGTSWSDGTPTADDDIQIAGDLNWTSSMVSSVNSWSQTAGTVTFETVFDNTGFDQFRVDNDVSVTGGSWTHLDNGTSETYRLGVDVGGNFNLGASASINAKALGYNIYSGPGGAVSGGYEEGGSYGGIGGGSAKLPYGSVETPVNLGSGGARTSGGGAVYLTIAGLASIDGEINADSGDTIHSGHGSGGSIYIQADSVAGSGALSASCGINGYGGRGRGSGGRIAVKLTGAGNDFASFQSTATIQATTRDQNGTKGGAGTIYLQKADGSAQLIVDNTGAEGEFTSAGTTPFTYGSNVEIITRNGGKLMIDNDDTIDFGTANLADGWTVRIAGADGVTVPATWLIENGHLMPDQLKVVNADVIVGTGGELTPHEANARMELKVDNLTVRDGGAIHADTYGYSQGPGYTTAKSERDGGSHAGQGGDRDGDGTQGPCYGSFLNPETSGSGTVNNPGLGGGIVILTVNGVLDIDGSSRISADGADDNESSGAGGTVNIIANLLSGSGRISADGGDHANYGAGGGGGRVAIRLAGGDFSGFAGAIQAFADSYSSDDGAGGSVYLQTATQAEGTGDMFIDFGSVSTDKRVELPPSYDPASFTDDLTAVPFWLQNGGKVELAGDAEIGNLAIDSTSMLYLMGHTLTVNSLKDPTFDDTRVVADGGQIVWVPEPGMLSLLALSAVGVLRRRRR